ncbi:hypothetical protein EON82_22075 [bacterium]|nr:MAG: hypothetical protein EON82_22075 [bacterium]
MSHVVMQAAEFPSLRAAESAEAELRAFMAAYGAYDDAPGPGDSPLVELGRAHGIVWPDDPSAAILVKGLFSQEAQLARIDRLVFFWFGGFDFGGEPFREVLRRLGAVHTADERTCHVVVRTDDAEGRAAALAEFLDEEDFEDQYTAEDAAAPLGEDVAFSVTFTGPKASKRLVFDTSGVQDWAFTNVLYQLTDDDPAFAR